MGLTSVVLGAVGLLLFFLPILGIPLGGVGLVFGFGGLVLALCRRLDEPPLVGRRNRPVGLALAVSLAIAQAPAGYLPSRAVPLGTQPVPDRPYVPPPARPGNASLRLRLSSGATTPSCGWQLRNRSAARRRRRPATSRSSELPG